MGHSAVDKILESRRPLGGSEAAAPASEGDKFSLILVGDNMEESFLELRLRSGLRTAFAYSDIVFLVYDPDSGSLDVDFGGYLVTVRGRGLGERVFDALKKKRVVWLKEADTEMQDHKGNELYIGGITITPPSAANENEAATV